jgi:uncharacterized protein
MERRFVSSKLSPITLEKRADGSSTIQGYGAVFYREGDPGTEYQLYGDLVERIMPGAFDRAIKEADDCRALVNHDPNLLLGRASAGTLKLSIDATGLRYEIDPPDTQAGRDACVSLERGDLTGSSFSFLPDDVTWREQGDLIIREVRSVQLFDVGPVTFPAYSSTTAGVRALGDAEEARKALEAWKEKRTSDKAAVSAAIAGYQARAAEVGSF